ncbi:MAG: protein tyrosine phosphatase [Betaproteobacteria bacterium]|nr:protein tyrosine phosphatase [Betaproteobacteria bacterium]MCL2885897.1 protein tyrosine phosphatase [Betaproteobacteria bacterium]
MNPFLPRLFRQLSLLALAALCLSALPARAEGEDALSAETAAILKIREGLANLTDYMATRPDLFPLRPPPAKRVLTPAQSQEARDLWARFLDYQLMLDAAWQRLSERDEANDKARFRAAYAAFLTRYRYALEFIRLADADPAMRVALNEPVGEIGLPERGYADFKFRFLHVAMAGEFASLAARYTTKIGTRRVCKQMKPLDCVFAQDEPYLWEAGRAHGLLNTLRNAGQIAQDGGSELIFPIQKGISEWMGQTRVSGGEQFLISAEQIAALRPRLQPGDILLERREWYLSNIGLPGFWPHAALYIGDAEERSAFFATPEIRAWLQTQGIADGNFETLLQTRQPAAYRLSQKPDDTGAMPRIIEAIGKGVSFTSLEHSAAADSLAVLRPRLSRLEIARALLKSFDYAGRPYDFDFDFRTDGQLVCTELVFKSYRPENDRQGLVWPLSSVAGRPVLTANNIVRHFDETWQTPAQQLDLIAFLDGNARANHAEESDLETFRASWRRPKWHIFAQEDARHEQ